MRRRHSEWIARGRGEVDAVEEAFAATLAEGPCVSTLDGRRALLREANEAIQAQVRGYYARPWADGDAEVVDRDFLCECGDTACDALCESRSAPPRRRC